MSQANPTPLLYDAQGGLASVDFQAVLENIRAQACEQMDALGCIAIVGLAAPHPTQPSRVQSSIGTNQLGLQNLEIVKRMVTGFLQKIDAQIAAQQNPQDMEKRDGNGHQEVANQK